MQCGEAVATTKVTVTAMDPTSVSIPKKSYTLNYACPTDGLQNATGKDIKWELEPCDAWYKDATWTSSDYSVAMVSDDGYVWATGAGTATITMKKDGDNTLELSAYNADTEEDVSVSWKSSNKSVATVVGGVVTAKKAGTAVITVTATDGSKKSAKITVTVNKK